MASVMTAIREAREAGETLRPIPEPNHEPIPELNHELTSELAVQEEEVNRFVSPEWTGGWDEPSQGSHTLNQCQTFLTHREQNDETGSAKTKDNVDLTGKLCWCVMIQWKVGANEAVMEHVVWVLEEWLHRREISIYTDLV
jgi:hypothetical protein